jgi:hypothetical protein
MSQSPSIKKQLGSNFIHSSHYGCTAKAKATIIKLLELQQTFD